MIQNNLAGINAHRNFHIINLEISKNLEKLSSGFKVNRAADNAAGLSISEKMRGQIRGLGTAEQNVMHGISLIQTAEGALGETHAILQRMRELAVQAANGTYQNEDRLLLDKEFQALKDEADRVAISTHYNGIKLLDGGLSGDISTTITSPDIMPTPSENTIDPNQMPMPPENTLVLENVTLTGTLYDSGEYYYAITQDTVIRGNVTFTDAFLVMPGVTLYIEEGAMLQAGDKYSLNGGIIHNSGTIKGSQFGNSIPHHLNFMDAIANGTFINYSSGHIDVSSFDNTLAGTSSKCEFINYGYAQRIVNLGHTINWGTIQDFVNDSDWVAGIADNYGIIVNLWNIDAGESTAVLNQYGNSVKIQNIRLNTGIINYLEMPEPPNTSEPDMSTSTTRYLGGLTLQIGAKNGFDQRLTIYMNSMRVQHIGTLLNGVFTSVANSHIRTTNDASDAISVVYGATNMVSLQRSAIGAAQNQLEHTLNNLGISKENLISCESVIRDVDVAKEMMAFTKNNILLQTSQSMLAQANQIPQGVLGLLR